MSKNFSKIVRKYIIHYQTSQMISNETINHRSKQNYPLKQQNITTAHMTSPNTKKKGIKTY